MGLTDRISGLTSKIMSKLALKQFVDINEQPLFKMPNYMFRMRYWLGALVAAAFVWEVVTGLFLLLNYYPSNPYGQTQYLISKIPFGAPILYSHLYGAYFMIFLAYIHLFRNYFDGAYKRPRQLLWVVGILLFAITLGTAFTGYSLPADILGADADGVAQGIVAGAPGGAILNAIIFGNGLSIDMYTRLLGWHVILTAILGGLVGVHFLLFEQYGVMPSKKVMEKAPAVYPKEEWEKFNPWFPRNFVYTLELTLFIWGLILIVPNVIINIPNIPAAIAPLISPAPLVPPTGTLPAGTAAYPPWFFLFLYKAIDFYQPTGGPYTPFMASLLAGLLPALYLLVLPWVDSSRETAAHKRTLFTGIGILLITYLVQLSVWGVTAAGVPEPFSVQVGIMLPPIIIAFTSLYLIPRAIHSKKGERTLTPKNAALLIVAGLVIVGTWSSLLQNVSIYLLGVFIPIALSLVLFATRFARGADAALPRAGPSVLTRTLGAGVGILLITYLLQLTVWIYTKQGMFSPVSTQAGVLLPPLVVLAVSLYLIPKAMKSEHGQRGLSPVDAVMIIIPGLVIAGTWSTLLDYRLVYLIGLLVPLVLSALLAVSRVRASKGAQAFTPDEFTRTAQEEKGPTLMTYSAAVIFMVFLFLVAAGILALMVRLPVTGQESTYWGIGTGIILLIFSYALSLYGYLYYPQENDEVVIVSGRRSRAVGVRRTAVQGRQAIGTKPDTQAPVTSPYASSQNDD